MQIHLNASTNPSYLSSDYRSLELHRVIAYKLLQNPSLLNIATSNIERWKKQNKFPQPYLDEWLVYIESDMETLINFMTALTEEAQRLRSSSPFAGILSNSERMAIFETFKNESTRT
jgi:hypothetical protein